jgi:hypothetical protein
MDRVPKLPLSWWAASFCRLTITSPIYLSRVIVDVDFLLSSQRAAYPPASALYPGAILGVISVSVSVLQVHRSFFNFGRSFSAIAHTRVF